MGILRRGSMPLALLSLGNGLMQGQINGRKDGQEAWSTDPNNPANKPAPTPTPSDSQKQPTAARNTFAPDTTLHLNLGLRGAQSTPLVNMGVGYSPFPDRITGQPFHFGGASSPAGNFTNTDQPQFTTPSQLTSPPTDEEKGGNGSGGFLSSLGRMFDPHRLPPAIGDTVNKSLLSKLSSGDLSLKDYTSLKNTTNQITGTNYQPPMRDRNFGLSSKQLPSLLYAINSGAKVWNGQPISRFIGPDGGIAQVPKVNYSPRALARMRAGASQNTGIAPMPVRYLSPGTPPIPQFVDR